MRRRKRKKLKDLSHAPLFFLLLFLFSSQATLLSKTTTAQRLDLESEPKIKQPDSIQDNWPTSTNTIKNPQLFSERLFGSSIEQSQGREVEIELPSNEFSANTTTNESSQAAAAATAPGNSHLLLLFALLVLINLIVILGNILVIVAVYATAKLRSVTNIFIVSLATADLMLGVFVLPYALMFQILDVWIFGKIWCRGWLVTDVWISTASILNLCAISVDRYVAVTRPVKYRSIMTPRRAKTIVAGVWIVSFLICFPPLLPQWNPSLSGGGGELSRARRWLDEDRDDPSTELNNNEILSNIEPLFGGEPLISHGLLEGAVAPSERSKIIIERRNRRPQLAGLQLETMSSASWATTAPTTLQSNSAQLDTRFRAITVIDNKPAERELEGREYISMTSAAAAPPSSSSPLEVRASRGPQDEAWSESLRRRLGGFQGGGGGGRGFSMNAREFIVLQAVDRKRSQPVMKSSSSEARNKDEAAANIKRLEPIKSLLEQLYGASDAVLSPEDSLKAIELLTGPRTTSARSKGNKKTLEVGVELLQCSRASNEQEQEINKQDNKPERNILISTLNKANLATPNSTQSRPSKVDSYEAKVGGVVVAQLSCVRLAKLVGKFEEVGAASRLVELKRHRDPGGASTGSGADVNLIAWLSEPRCVGAADGPHCVRTSGLLLAAQTLIKGDKDIDYRPRSRRGGKLCGLIRARLYPRAKPNGAHNGSLAYGLNLLTRAYCNLNGSAGNAGAGQDKERVKRQTSSPTGLSRLTSAERPPPEVAPAHAEEEQKRRQLEPGAELKSSNCALFDDKPYVIYSALGSFYIPMLVMIFFYSRIYLVASRAHKAMQRGYMTTKWPAGNKRLSAKSRGGGPGSNCAPGAAEGTPLSADGSGNWAGAGVERVTLRIHRREKSSGTSNSLLAAAELSSCGGAGDKCAASEPESILVKLSAVEQHQQSQRFEQQASFAPPKTIAPPVVEIEEPAKIEQLPETVEAAIEEPEVRAEREHCHRRHHRHHRHHHRRHHAHHNHNHRHNHHHHRHHHHHHRHKAKPSSADNCEHKSSQLSEHLCSCQQTAAANESNEEQLMHSCIAEEISEGTSATMVAPSVGLAKLDRRRSGGEQSSVNSVQITVSQFDEIEAEKALEHEQEQEQEDILAQEEGIVSSQEDGIGNIFVAITPPAQDSANAKCERSHSVDTSLPAPLIVLPSFGNQSINSKQLVPSNNGLLPMNRVDRSHSCGPTPTIVVNWNPETGLAESQLGSNLSSCDFASGALVKSSPSLVEGAAQHDEGQTDTKQGGRIHGGSQGSGLSIMANLPNQVRKQSIMLLSSLTTRSSQTLRRLSMVASHPVESLLNRANKGKASDVESAGFCGADSTSEQSSAQNKRRAKKKSRKTKKSRSATPGGGSKRTFDDYLMAVTGIDSSSDDYDQDEDDNVDGDGDEDEEAPDEEEDEEGVDEGSVFGKEDKPKYSLLFGLREMSLPQKCSQALKADLSQTKIAINIEDNVDGFQPEKSPALVEEAPAERKELTTTTTTTTRAEEEEQQELEKSLLKETDPPPSTLQRKGACYERATSRDGLAAAAIHSDKNDKALLSATNGVVVNGEKQSGGFTGKLPNSLVKVRSPRTRRGFKQTSRWHAKRLHAETKAAKTVAIIIGGFIFCWLPFFTVYLSRAIICERSDCIPRSLLSLFIWLGYLNSAINPVIYGLFSADFRHAFKNIVCRCRLRNTDDTIVVSVLVDSIIKSIL